MKKMNKKGFTLIELLAVIIILGVLMIIAIPAVTSYIQNSRKSAYVDTAMAYVKAVTTKVNEGHDMQLFSTDTLYLIPVGDKLHDATSTGDGKVSCVAVESGGQSPFSSTWKYAYVGAIYNGQGYEYFFVSEDGAGQGLTFMTSKELQDEGSNDLYTNTGDSGYTNAKTGSTIAMSGDLHDALVTAYSDKELHVLNECGKNRAGEDLSDGNNCKNGASKYTIAGQIDTDSAYSKMMVLAGNKTRLVIYGTCHD